MPTVIDAVRCLQDGGRAWTPGGNEVELTIMGLRYIITGSAIVFDYQRILSDQWRIEPRQPELTPEQEERFRKTCERIVADGGNCLNVSCMDCPGSRSNTGNGTCVSVGWSSRGGSCERNPVVEASARRWLSEHPRQPAAPEAGEGWELCERKDAEFAWCSVCKAWVAFKSGSSAHASDIDTENCPDLIKHILGLTHYRRRVKATEDVAIYIGSDGDRLYDVNSRNVLSRCHVLAPSERGFLGYVYEDDTEYMPDGLHLEPVRRVDGVVVFPIAWRRVKA